jgi:hypothetical protein
VPDPAGSVRRTGGYVVVYAAEGTRYKLCRVFFGRDGSYYVTCPYHSAGEQAVVFKMTVNYARQTQDITFEEALDVAALDDPNRGIKLSHHPDGFIQFSGAGIESGLDANGNPRGIGIMSWAFARPAAGPSFGVTIHGLDGFATEPNERDGDVTYTVDDVEPISEPRIFVVEGYFLPALWRRFVVRDEANRPIIRIVHPTGAILQLRAVSPPEAAEQYGFIGIELYSDTKELPDPDHGFIISSSTGNIRRNEHGELLGDAIACTVPRATLAARRRLEHQPPPAQHDAGEAGG